MTSNLTIRMDNDFKRRIQELAKQMGVPLSLVIRNALEVFEKTQFFVVGKAENIDPTPKMQEQMMKLSSILEKKKGKTLQKT